VYIDRVALRVAAIDAGDRRIHSGLCFRRVVTLLENGIDARECGSVVVPPCRNLRDVLAAFSTGGPCEFERCVQSVDLRLGQNDRVLLVIISERRERVIFHLSVMAPAPSGMSQRRGPVG
jgi:hypothetical protein